VLQTHPAVAGASIIGAPDPDWGEVLVAFVQAKPEKTPSAEDLEAFCRERLASYKVPRIWRFVDKFPQTTSGKIQKFALQDAYIGETPRRAVDAPI
jgi:fatty-acyl-CoA synthase